VSCLAVSAGLRIACLALTLYWFVLFARIIASWFPPPRYGSPLGPVMRVIYELTDPVLRPLRNLIPPLRMGVMAVDFSPIIVFILIGVVQRAIGCLGF
jgi:YggT family protein